MLGAFADAQEAQASDFSVDDYGDGGAVGPFQIMEPSYPAPKWLNTYRDLNKALRECQTLCTLQGRPFRVMRWGREGSGARGGIPCRVCKPTPSPSRFPRHVLSGCTSCGPDTSRGAKPVAEFRPNGTKLIFDAKGNAHIVGKPDYVVSRNPFPRTYEPRRAVQHYMDAVMSGQALANHESKRVFVCSGFGADCRSKIGIPVVYVDPGGLVRRYQNNPEGTVVVNPVSPEYFQELVAEGRGRSFLPQGA
jgi:hypothetical protein